MQRRIEYLHMTRAIHRLHRVVALFRLGGEHVLAVILPVTGLLPQHAVHHQRRLDLAVTGLVENVPHVLLDLLPDNPTLGMPEHHARRLFLHVEQVELLAQPPVVALFGFLEHVQIGVLLVLLRPGSAVDPLQHFVLCIAAPVGAGHLHELENL